MPVPFEILIVEDEQLTLDQLTEPTVTKQSSARRMIQSVTAPLKAMANRRGRIYAYIKLDNDQAGAELGKMLNDDSHIPFTYVMNGGKDLIRQAKLNTSNAYLVKLFEKEDLMGSLKRALTDISLDFARKQNKQTVVN